MTSTGISWLTIFPSSDCLSASSCACKAIVVVLRAMRARKLEELLLMLRAEAIRSDAMRISGSNGWRSRAYAGKMHLDPWAGKGQRVALKTAVPVCVDVTA
jgi:hypothetical protein